LLHLLPPRGLASYLLPLNRATWPPFCHQGFCAWNTPKHAPIKKKTNVDEGEMVYHIPVVGGHECARSGKRGDKLFLLSLFPSPHFSTQTLSPLLPPRSPLATHAVYSQHFLFPPQLYLFP
jgi:hypothetical protein